MKNDASPIQTISILGCGWLGLPLGKTLVEEGFRVKGSTTTAEKLDQIAAAGIQPFLLTVEADISGDDPRDFFTADLLILNIPPGGRRPGVEQRFPQQIERITAAAREGGVNRMLFVSSTGVFGDRPGERTEADPPDPDRPAGRALREAEAWLAAQPDLAVTILRPGGLAGGERQPGRWLAGKQDLPDGDAPVNLVHRDDVIGVILTIIRRDHWGDIFHVVADHKPTRRNFYPAQARRRGLPPPTFLEQGGSGKSISNEKVKRVLGYRFLHPDPDRFPE